MKIAAAIVMFGLVAGIGPDERMPTDIVGEYVAAGSESEVSHLQLMEAEKFVVILGEGPRARPRPSSPTTQSTGTPSTASASTQAVEDHPATRPSKARDSSGREYSGAWTIDNGKLVLTPEYDEDREPYPPLPVRWLMIRWDTRLYLVPEGRMLDFCNAVNLGIEPRSTAEGRFLIRHGQWETAVNGPPVVPDDLSEHLLREPVRGRLQSIDELGFGHLDVGENQGLRAGMVLVVFSEGRMRACRLKVLCPCEDSARVELVCPGSSSSDVESAPGGIDVAVGDRVSTSLKPADSESTLNPEP